MFTWLYRRRGTHKNAAGPMRGAPGPIFTWLFGTFGRARCHRAIVRSMRPNYPEVDDCGSSASPAVGPALSPAGNVCLKGRCNRATHLYADTCIGLSERHFPLHPRQDASDSGVLWAGGDIFLDLLCLKGVIQPSSRTVPLSTGKRMVNGLLELRPVACARSSLSVSACGQSSTLYRCWPWA